MKHMQNWWQLSTIQIGGVICLPVFMIGQTLSQHYGFFSALIAILIGNAILLILGLITAKMSHTNRKTTMENAQVYFGEKGIPFFAFALAASLIGWFGIQLNMMSLGVIDLLSIGENQRVWSWIFNIGLGALIISVAAFGLKGVQILANISLPFLLMTIGYAFFTVDTKQSFLIPSTFTFGGTSLVIAMAIALVVDLPTYYRHAATLKDGYISIALIFGFVLPLLEMIGVYLAIENGEGTILDVLRRENETLWNVWVAIFLILAGWTTNNINLYSAAISLQSIIVNISEKRAILYVGTLGTVLACFDVLSHLETVLSFIGVIISSMGAVVLSRYLIMEYLRLKNLSKDYASCLFAWGLGIGAGILGIQGMSLTSVPVLDALITGFVAMSFILIPRKTYEKAYFR